MLLQANASPPFQPSAQRCSRHPPAQQINKKRSPRQRRHRPHRQFRRRHHRTPDRVRNHHCDRSAKRGRRQQNSMIRSKNLAHHVRHQQPNITNRPSHGSHHRRQQRCRDIHHQSHPRKVHAQMHGFFFARQKQI